MFSGAADTTLFPPRTLSRPSKSSRFNRSSLVLHESIVSPVSSPNITSDGEPPGCHRCPLHLQFMNYFCSLIIKNYKPSQTHVTFPELQPSSATTESDWVSCQSLFQSQSCRIDTNLSALRHSRSRHPNIRQRPLPHGLFPRNHWLRMWTIVDLQRALDM